MLTLRPRSARTLTLPTGDRESSWTNLISTRSRSIGSVSRPPVWIWVPALVIAALSLVPIGYLFARAFLAGDVAWELLFRAKTASVVVNSLTLALAVALSTVLIAMPLAWLTSRTDLPWRGFWSVAAALPLVVPSYIGAVVTVAVFGPRGSAQALLAPLGIERLPSLYGFTGAWIVLTLFTYPYVYLTVRSALRGLDPSLEDAARCLGYGPWRTFFAVTLPQLRPAAAAGGLLTALYALGDFGVPTLLRYDAFTRAIYVQYKSALDRGAAAMLALLLVVLSIVVLAIETRARGNASLHRLGSGVNRRPRIVRLGRGRYPALLFCATIVGLALVLPVGVLLFWLVRSLTADGEFSGLAVATAHSVTLGVSTALVATLAALPIAILAVTAINPRVALSIAGFQ